MSAYSREEKLKKDKIYHAPLKEEQSYKETGEKQGQKVLKDISKRQTIKLTNYFSSFSADTARDWDGDKKTAVITSTKDFRHRTLSLGEKAFDHKRKSPLFSGARTAYANNLNKEKSAVFLRARQTKTASHLVEQYKELVEKSDNLALHKSISFLSKEPEKNELRQISHGKMNQNRINYLRDVMNLKDQRALEFKNKLIKSESIKPALSKKREFDLIAFRRIVNALPPEEKQIEEKNEDVNDSSKQ